MNLSARNDAHMPTTERAESDYPVYPSVYPMPLPPDLRAAYESASFLLEAASSIVHLLVRAEATNPPCEEVQSATEQAVKLRRTYKEHEHKISVICNEITSANLETVKLPTRILTEFPNTHYSTLDIAGLVCELLWDGSYRERGFDSPEELYGLPLTPEVVTTALPVIARHLQYHLGKVDWRELKRRLLIEAATAAHTREKERAQSERTEWTPADSPNRWAKLFGFSPRTFLRRIEAGTIRVKRLSAKSYQVAIEDLPAMHQAKFRSLPTS